LFTLFEMGLGRGWKMLPDNGRAPAV